MVANSFPLRNSYQLVPQLVAAGYLASMRPRDRRRENLERLVAEFGTQAEVARRGRTSEKYLWQIINGVKQRGRGTPRGIGDDLAARLEAGCEKAVGWMDQDHSAEPWPGGPSDKPKTANPPIPAATTDRAAPGAKLADAIANLGEFIPVRKPLSPGGQWLGHMFDMWDEAELDAVWNRAVDALATSAAIRKAASVRPLRAPAAEDFGDKRKRAGYGKRRAAKKR